MAEDMFPLPPAGTHEEGFPLEVGILELWNTPIPDINGMFADSVRSSLPHHRLGETISVPVRYTGPYYFTIRSDGSRHGLGLRLELTSRDFKDLWVCLHDHNSG